MAKETPPPKINATVYNPPNPSIKTEQATLPQPIKTSMNVPKNSPMSSFQLINSP